MADRHAAVRARHTFVCEQNDSNLQQIRRLLERVGNNFGQPWEWATTRRPLGVR